VLNADPVFFALARAADQQQWGYQTLLNLEDFIGLCKACNVSQVTSETCRDDR
jgi:hypothetical protein